ETTISLWRASAGTCRRERAIFLAPCCPAAPCSDEAVSPRSLHGNIPYRDSVAERQPAENGPSTFRSRSFHRYPTH
ncbi:8f2bea2d-3d12-42e8-ada5-1b7131b311c5, partial [Thermothielavioides terrestris]